MPMIDLTETAEYRMQMEEAIEANAGWFDRLGYDDADFELKAWMLWHRTRGGLVAGDEGARMPRNTPMAFSSGKTERRSRP